MPPAEHEARLSSWGAWCRVSRMPRDCARSAEGLWRSPQCWNVVTHAPITVNPGDAWAVEQVVVRLFAPFRLALALRYVNRVPDIVLGRVLRRRYEVSDAQAALDRARHRVTVGLDGSARPRSAPI